MPTIRDFVAVVEHFAPPHIAFPADPIGLHVGDLDAPVTRLAVTLDCTEAALDYGIEKGCEALLCHHPVVYEPLAGVNEQDRVGALLRKAIKYGVAILSAHTNLDNASPGINDTLAGLLSLTKPRPFGVAVNESVWLLVTYCPAESAQAIIDSARHAGAGKIGEYTGCAYSSEGVGQFTPSTAANPDSGKVGQENHIPETRLEIYTPDSRRQAVIAAVRAVHPYEEPLVSLLATGEPIKHAGGRIGSLPKALNALELKEYVNQELGCKCQIWAPQVSKPLATMAVTGGAASFDWENSIRAGADIFLTGEAKQAHVIEATERGLVVVQAGHYHTEHPGIIEFGHKVARKMNLAFLPFEPEPGRAGRPF